MVDPCVCYKGIPFGFFLLMNVVQCRRLLNYQQISYVLNIDKIINFRN